VLMSHYYPQLNELSQCLSLKQLSQFSFPFYTSCFVVVVVVVLAALGFQLKASGLPGRMATT
jgi:uncharacterized protein YacL